MVAALIGLVLGLATMAALASPYPVLALGPAIGALGGTVVLRRPEVLVYAIVAMIPFGAYRKIGGINLPWLCVAILAALLPIRMAISHRLPGLLPTMLWPLLLAFLGVNTLATLLSPFRETADHELFVLTMSELLILLVIAYLPPRGLTVVLHRVVVWSIAVGSLLGLAGYVFGINALSEGNPDGTDYRAMGGAIDPNNQSIMTLFALPLTVHLALTSESRRERLVMTGLSFVNVLGVLLTMSRSGFLMLVVTCGLLGWHYRHLIRPRRLGLMIAGGLVGGVVMIGLLPQEFWTRQGSLVAWEDRSLSRRTSYLGVAAEAIAANPVLGTGTGTFQDHYARSEVTRMYTAQAQRMRRHAHNSYIEVIVGSGVIGLALYLAIVLVILRHLTLARRAFERRGDSRMADLMACYRIGFSVLCVFLLMLSDPTHKYLLLTAGLSQVALGLSGALERRPSSRET